MFRVLFLGLALTGMARADWKDLSPGLDSPAVRRLVGPPLLMTHARNRMFEMWTYDDGGHVMFTNGRVRFWKEPRSKRPVNPGLSGREPPVPAPPKTN